jgi:hypothetical protein
MRGFASGFLDCLKHVAGLDLLGMFQDAIVEIEDLEDLHGASKTNGSLNRLG